MRNNLKLMMLVGLCTGLALQACQQKEKQTNTTTVASSPNSAQQIKSAADSTHLIGVWFDEDLKLEQGQRVAYELVAKGHKTYIQVITFTGKKLNVNDNPDLSPSASELKKSGDKYISIERPNEIYSFDKAQNLLIYDETGLVMKCKRML